MKTKSEKMSAYRRPALVDAEKMARDNPGTFSIPLGRDTLAAGDLAKVSCCGERFWCIVVMVRDGLYFGRIDNNLILSEQHGLLFGDLIRFAPRNVHQIQRVAEVPAEPIIHP